MWSPLSASTPRTDSSSNSGQWSSSNHGRSTDSLPVSPRSMPSRSSNSRSTTSPSSTTRALSRSARHPFCYSKLPDRFPGETGRPTKSSLPWVTVDEVPSIKKLIRFTARFQANFCIYNTGAMLLDSQLHSSAKEKLTEALAQQWVPRAALWKHKNPDEEGKELDTTGSQYGGEMAGNIEQIFSNVKQKVAECEGEEGEDQIGDEEDEFEDAEQPVSENGLAVIPENDEDEFEEEEGENTIREEDIKEANGQQEASEEEIYEEEYFGDVDVGEFEDYIEDESDDGYGDESSLFSQNSDNSNGLTTPPGYETCDVTSTPDSLLTAPNHCYSDGEGNDTESTTSTVSLISNDSATSFVTNSRWKESSYCVGSIKPWREPEGRTPSKCRWLPPYDEGSFPAIAEFHPCSWVFNQCVFVYTDDIARDEGELLDFFASDRWKGIRFIPTQSDLSKVLLHPKPFPKGTGIIYFLCR